MTDNIDDKLTKYPPKTTTSLFYVCTCGHFYHEHNESFAYWFMPYGHSKGDCKKCECPKYRKLGRFTYKETMAIQAKLGRVHEG